MASKECQVKVQGDHLTKVSSSSPDKALAELIWNSLDADATIVEVYFPKGNIGEYTIIVQDNGNGFAYENAEKLFGQLGGSWKSSKEKTPNGRFLHGKEGQGRFKAFALGRCAEWEVKNKRPFKLTAISDHLERFSLDLLEETDDNSFVTSVTISELHRGFQILNADIAVERLLPIFALYLRTYPGIKIMIEGIPLNPDNAIVNARSIFLNEIEYNGQKYRVGLEII